MSQPIMNGGYYFSPSGTPYTYQVGQLGHPSTFQNVISNLKQLAFLYKNFFTIIFNLIRVVVIREAPFGNVLFPFILALT